ncbi:MAG: histidine phosphatase family protein [Acidimicrobiales bacterium]
MTDTPATAPEGFRQHRFVPPPGATRVLLVRHGESAPAVPDRPFPLADGHGDPPLHPDGVLQAQAVGARLAASESIAAIYVTTLQRTHQTAAPLAALVDLVPVVEPDLREVHLGEWEGGNLRVRAAAGDPLFAEVVERERWDVIPGAEPLESFDARLQAGLGRIVAAHPDETVVAVVHGGVIGQLLAHAVGISGFAFVASDNASISELVVHGDRQTVRRYNDTAHLEARTPDDA